MTTNKSPQGSAAGLLEQGFMHHREGRLSDAEPLYRAALRQEPNNAQALHLLGMLEGQRGRLPVALDFLRRAAASDGGNAHLHNNLGETLRHLGRHLEAIDAFLRAVSLDSSLLAAWEGAADCARAEAERAETA